MHRADRGLLGVLGIAVAVRVLALQQATGAPFWATPIMDEAASMRVADALIRGVGPPHGAHYAAPGYAYFLAAIHAFGGGVALIKLIQLALGVANSLLVWRLARRCFGAREAALAGVLWAVYPLALFHEVLLLKPTLAVLASLLALVAIPAEPEHGTGEPGGALTPRALVLRWAAAGLLFGVASVTQGEIAIVVLLVGIVGATRSRPAPPAPARKRSASARTGRVPATPRIAWLAGAAAFVLVLAVPTLENAARGAGFVVVAYGGGTNLYIGNHAGADGSYVPLRSFRSDPAFEESDAVTLAEAAIGHAPRPAEVSRYWRDRALGWWRDEPAAALRLTAQKLALLWGPQEQADVLDSAMASRWMGVLRNPIVHPRLLLPLALVGLWLARRRREAWPLRTFVLGTTLAIVPFFVFERFRLPMTAACLPFAAHAVVRGWDALRARRLVPVAAGLAAVLAIALVAGRARVTRERAVMRANVGNLFLLRGRFEEALAEFEAVRAARPEAFRVEVSIATALAGLGRNDDALRTLDSVVVKLRAEERATGRTPREELAMCEALAREVRGRSR